MLYEVAVIEKSNDGQDKVLIGPVAMTAESEIAAAFRVGAELGAREENAYGKIEVLVRPFLAR